MGDFLSKSMNEGTMYLATKSSALGGQWALSIIPKITHSEQLRNWFQTTIIYNIHDRIEVDTEHGTTSHEQTCK